MSFHLLCVVIIMKSQTKKQYCIYEQVYRFWTIPVCHIAENTGISRNTVSTYIHEMYTNSIMQGPYTWLKAAPNYREYLYLMHFKDPLHVYRGLKGFPHVVYTAATVGDWNTMVITDRLLDFCKLVGFQGIVFQGAVQYVYTPKVGYRSWDNSFERIYEEMDTFTLTGHKNRGVAPVLDWDEPHWKVYHVFKWNMRKKVTPTLQPIKVRYEHYKQWLKSLDNHCTICTGFYPEGYHNSIHCCFLLSTDYDESVISLFSLFPATPWIIPVGKKLFVVATVRSLYIKKVFSLLDDMKEKRIIKSFNNAVSLFDSKN